METLYNKTELALLYFEVLGTPQYDRQNPKDRTKARANFLQNTHDRAALRKALALYLRAIKNEVLGESVSTH